MNYREIFLKGKDLKGTYVELGFGSGNSASTFIELIKSNTITNRPIRIYDSFKGLPTPTEKDLEFDNSLTKGKFSKPIQPALDLRFEIPGTDYKVVKGFIEETTLGYDSGPISILNLDLTTYSSSLVALENLHKYLIKFGLLVVPSYITNTGVKQAVDYFLAKNNLTHQVKDGITFINSPAPKTLIGRLKRDESLEEKRVPINKELAPVPFKDKYKRKEADKVTYNKTVRTDVKVLDKKVTR